MSTQRPTPSTAPTPSTTSTGDRPARVLAVVGLVLGLVTVAFGWWVALAGDANDGTARSLLVIAAGAATVALAVAVALARAGHPLGAALMFVLVAVSPTVFAYPLNVAVVLLGLGTAAALTVGRARRAPVVR